MSDPATQQAPRGICYVVQSHREPALVERLVATLTAEDERCSVVIKHDATRERLDETALASDRVRVLQSTTSTPWATWAQTEASLAGVRAALDLEWDWIVLLTGQSYPLAPPASFARWLETQEEEAVFDFSRGGPGSQRGFWSYRPQGADRARYAFFNLPDSRLWGFHTVRRVLVSLTENQPLVRAGFHFRGDPPGRAQGHVLVYNPWSPFAQGARPLKAGQCWCLRRERAVELLGLLDGASGWNRHFRHSFTSDELAIPSFVTDRGATIGDHVLHAQRWPSGPGPQTLDVADWAWVQQQTAPFVRKVTLANGSQLLDRIDALRMQVRSGTNGGGLRP